MKFEFRKSRRLFFSMVVGVIFSTILACSLFLYFNSSFSIYPNADFEKAQNFSISRDTFPFIITAPSNTLPPCVRVSYQITYSTRDAPPQVANWFQENGWSTGVGTNRASGMKRSFADLPFINFANWIWVAIKEQSGGVSLIEVDRVHVVCFFL